MSGKSSPDIFNTLAHAMETTIKNVYNVPYLCDLLDYFLLLSLDLKREGH